MKFSSLLYPLRCPICDQVTDPLRPRICDACRRNIPYCGEPRCVICGKSILSDSGEYCADCMEMHHLFRQGRAVWKYSGPVVDSLHRYKFANRRMYAPFYAQEMMREMGSWLMSRRADALIPVPITDKRRRARGYNQAALIAQPLSVYTGIEMREDILMRREGFRQQKELSRKMRRLNLRRAFYTVPVEDLPHTVILIDDIYTTGSTIDAAAYALMHAGVKNVYAAYLCVGES